MSATSASRNPRPQLLSVHQLMSAPDRRQSERQAPLPPLRLTRRGKIVLIGIPLVLLAALLLSLAGFFNSPAKASDSAADLSVTPTVTVTVQPGQSLWAIAGNIDPERDARDVVADIVQLNNLTGGAVLPGQQLFVPTR
jgi:hypothetical protein